LELELWQNKHPRKPKKQYSVNGNSIPIVLVENLLRNQAVPWYRWSLPTTVFSSYCPNPNRQYIIYRAYSFEEKDNKVVSVKLNAPLEGVDTHIAMIIAIEVEETHGVIDIDFTINIFVDLNHFFYTSQLRNLIGMPFFYLYLEK